MPSRDYKVILTFGLFLVLNSCEDVVEVKLKSGPEKLVVDGEISNQSGPYAVHLTTNAPFFNQNSTPKVVGARVRISDNLNNQFVLAETSAGVYHTDDQFIGMPGNSYTLHITTPDGIDFQSLPELLPLPVQMDSLYLSEFFAFEEEFSDYLTVDFTDPPDVANFYYWKFYVNGRFQNLPEDIQLLSTNPGFDGQIITGVTFDSFSVLPEDTVKVQMLNITQKTYQFLTHLKVRLVDTGTPFETPAAPILGNVFNVDDPDQTALGFFRAASIVEETIIVQD